MGIECSRCNNSILDEFYENDPSFCHFEAKKMGYKYDKIEDTWLCPYCKLKKPVRKIKAISEKQKKKNAELKIIREELHKEQRKCQFPNCKKDSAECHHKKGREGKNTTDKENLIYLCKEHHDWVENNRAEAMEMGLRVSRHWSFATRDDL